MRTREKRSTEAVEVLMALAGVCLSGLASPDFERLRS